MKSKNEKLLSKLVEQFKVAHQGALPERIVVEPVALVALGIKKSVAQVWEGVKVECREIGPKEPAKPGKGTKLAVLLDTKSTQIVACDLI
jgi:hypothetical protein